MNDIIMFISEADGADYKTGPLPPEAPLATAWVPRQRGVTPQYDPEQALIRGTLFPGLDLPFRNIVNNSMPDTPLGELMALDFILNELVLYLDTHMNDTEAFDLYQNFLSLAAEGRRRFTALYGPISHSDMAGAESFTWLDGPWPWEYRDYSERMGNF